MMLTRWFITSYLVINDYDITDSFIGKRFNGDFIDIYTSAAQAICDQGIMLLREPPEDEKKQQNLKVSIAVAKQRTLKELIEEVFFDFPQLSSKNKKTITARAILFVEGETELELFTNPYLHALFPELHHVDVYKALADKPVLNIMHPQKNKNAICAPE